MRFVAPARKQPRIFQAIKSGYETMAGNAYLVLFPILFDLYFLLGRRYLVTNMVQDMIDSIIFPPSASTEILETWQELSASLIDTLQHFSLSGFLRSFPIGIPSLLAYRPMEVSPLGAFSTVQLESYGQFFLAIIGFSTIGFLLGVLFLFAVSYAVRDTHTESITANLAQKFLSLLALPLVVILVFVFILTPAIFLISILNALLPILGAVGYFFLTLTVISLSIPLIFTAHDILLYGSNFREAVKQSIQIVRPTNGKTSIFLFVAIMATYVTNFLWQIPADGSYMLLISILGHALVTTTFYVASFYFYIDARKSVRESLLTETNNSEHMSV
ncbi:MAG: hypothetical protein GX603_00290 [Chloroflexi bacterium]|nr:hypothetical protein [Chloroflexota bacterium]